MCEFFQLVTRNAVSEAEKMLSIGTASVDQTDSTGMTALMHAAYKGHTEMCRMLLKQGSDVNADTHAHSYTPLHFAALSSRIDTSQLLLDAGARTYKVNSVGRTAAQMAGFVGHSACVAAINNHVNPAELQRFWQPAAPNQTTRLRPEAARPLHELIMQVNLHPIHLALTACRLGSPLLSNLADASRVLYKLSKEETARSSGVNEVLALKFHYLGYVTEQLQKEYEAYSVEAKDAVQQDDISPPLAPLLKRWAKHSASGHTPHAENVVRQAIRSFHALDMPLFLQLGRSLAPDTRALDALRSVISGQRGFAPDAPQCALCEAEDAPRRCARCHQVYYCARECQKLHWNFHKKTCEEGGVEGVRARTEELAVK